MRPDEVAAQYTKRIDELLAKLDVIESIPKTEDRSAVDGCFLGTLTVIESLYGANSPQAKALLEGRKAYTKTQYSTQYELSSLSQSLKGTLLNVREELAAGLIRSISTEAAGEVIGDLIALARSQLKAGYKDVAAVLATAALEDSLKRKADELGINVEGKTLDQSLTH